MYQQDWKDAEEWNKKYGPETNPEATTRLFSIAILHQTLGMLVRENLIDPSLIYREDPWAVVETWEKVGPIVKALRENDPTFLGVI